MSKHSKKNKKKNKFKSIIIGSLLGLLAIIIAAFIGVAAYALMLYGKMNIVEIGDVTIDQSKADAAEALEQGVSLNAILKDEENYRFTLQDVNELKYYYMDWLQSQTGEEDSDTSNTLDIWKEPPDDEELPPESDKILNILFLGTDERNPGEKGRTDAIMMVTINTDKKSITLTSIMRDTYVKLWGYKNRYDRINTAYFLPTGHEAGVACIENTITSYLGIEFDNYAKVNFNSFAEVIDAIGGVDIELTDAEVTNLQKHTALDGGEVFNPEKQRVDGTKNTYHLNGKFALRYCRDRYTGNGDFGRTERQRQILVKIIERAQAMSLGELMDFIPVVLPLITTDLSIADCTSLLASVGTSYSSYKIQTFRVPADKTWSYETIGGMSVLGVNLEENRKQLHQLIFG